MKLRYFYLLAMAVSLIFSGRILAASIVVQPDEIKINAVSGNSIQKEILVKNPDQNVALYEVFVDAFQDKISVSPASFILENGGKQNVLVRIKSSEEGIFSTAISVVTKPLSQRQFKANIGVKIPLEIKVAAGDDGNVLLARISQGFRNLIGIDNSSIYLIVILIAFILKKHFYPYFLRKEI